MANSALWMVVNLVVLCAYPEFAVCAQVNRGNAMKILALPFGKFKAV